MTLATDGNGGDRGRRVVFASQTKGDDFMANSPEVVTALALQQAIDDAAPVDLSWIDPPPPDDGWTLAADALRFIYKIVASLKPRHILEFGCGLSTRVLVRAGDAAGLKIAVSSIDHDPEFGRPAAGSAPLGSPTVKVSFQFAPLVARDCGGKLLGSYLLDATALASPDPVDLVIIDGPPVTLGGREGVLYQVMSHARPGTLVLLDDASRESERRAVDHWQDVLGNAIEVKRLKNFAKGMVAIIIRKPILRDRLWEQRLRRASELVASIVPEGRNYIQIDPTTGELGGRTGLPLVQRDGQDWGPPADDDQAIKELEHHRRAGSTHCIFLWTAFWWLECYPRFHAHLRRTARLVAEGDLLVAFDLYTTPPVRSAGVPL